jgi:hypothetical protein
VKEDEMAPRKKKVETVEADHAPKTEAEKAATQYRHEHGLPADALVENPHVPEPSEAAVTQRLLTSLVDAVREVSRAIREVGLALVAQDRPVGRVQHTSESPSASEKAAVSLPPTAPTADAKPSRQGEHGGGPKQPSVKAETVTLQQAQQAVLRFSAVKSSTEAAAILKSLGVERVSAITGADAPAKYAAIVDALKV